MVDQIGNIPRMQHGDRFFIVYNITWALEAEDVQEAINHDCTEKLLELPSAILLEDFGSDEEYPIEPNEDISEHLSDKYGYLVTGFDYQVFTLRDDNYTVMFGEEDE